ncbi:MAG: transcriptional regulator NrdR [Clostridia bacterium]
MKCLFCGYSDSKVIDSRSTDDMNSIRRRRECLKCGKRFTTYETVETAPILVIKNNGGRQPFDVSKIKKGVIRACEKRPISLAQIEDVCMSVEKELQNSLSGEIKSSEIGEIVMRKLKEIDEVAYVRFASVYRKFADVEYFKEFINKL